MVRGILRAGEISPTAPAAFALRSIDPARGGQEKRGNPKEEQTQDQQRSGDEFPDHLTSFQAASRVAGFSRIPDWRRG